MSEIEARNHLFLAWAVVDGILMEWLMETGEGQVFTMDLDRVFTHHEGPIAVAFNWGNSDKGYDYWSSKNFQLRQIYNGCRFERID